MIKRKKKLSINFFVVSGLFLILILYLTFIVYFSVPIIKNSLESSNNAILETITDSFKNTVQEKFNILSNSLNLSKDIISLEELYGFQTKSIEKKLLSIIHRFPEIADLYIGFPNENFIMVQRFDTVTRTKIIKNNQTTWIERNKLGKIIKQSSEENKDFKTTKRDWYLSAKLKKSSHTSSMRRFYTRNILGLTQSTPYYKQNDLVSIFGANISLSNLSEITDTLLKKSKVHSLILDQEGFIIAHHSKLLSNKNSNIPIQIKNVNDSIFYPYLIKNEDSNSNIVYKNKNYSFYTKRFTFIEDKEWRILTAISQDIYLSPIRKAFKIVIVATLLLFTIIISIFLILSYLITEPIKKITLETLRIKQLNFSKSQNKASYISEIEELQESIEIMKNGLKAFTRYVPKNVIQNVITKKFALTTQSEKKTIAILFSDIENYSKISEMASPQMITNQLSEYFDICGEIIAKNMGQIDKYIGDSIMSFWANEESETYNALLCTYSALEISQKLQSLDQYWKNKYGNLFNTRFGLNSGEVTIGNIGSKYRLDYTIIGSPVNVANRLESTNKYYGTKILISKSLASLIENNIVVIPLDIVIFENTTNSEEIFTILDVRNKNNSFENLEAKFTEAVELFRLKSWKDALKIFKELKQQHPDFKPIDIYLERISYLLDNMTDNWSYILDLNRTS